MYEAVTGRPTYPLVARRIDRSVGEIKLLGVSWAIFWLALAVYALVGAFMDASHQTVPLLFMTVFPLILAATGFHALMEQHHNRRWPFKREIGN